MNILEEINKITDTLQAGQWSNHPPQMLISAQGKLSVYLASLGSMVADARKEMDNTELHAKHYEAEQFLSARESGESIQSAQAMSRVEAFNHWTRHYDAKSRYNDLKSVLSACESMITACQVTIREMKADREASNYHQNV